MLAKCIRREGTARSERFPRKEGRGRQMGILRILHFRRNSFGIFV